MAVMLTTPPCRLQPAHQKERVAALLKETSEVNQKGAGTGTSDPWLAMRVVTWRPALPSDLLLRATTGNTDVGVYIRMFLAEHILNTAA